MRKITSFLASALLCLSATGVYAQDLDEFGMTPVINDVSMLESPFSDADEGQDIGALIDNDGSTFWHTDWHGAVEGDHHWLQVNFTEPIAGNYVLFMQRRAVTNDHPTVIAVDASDDGETWTVVDTLTLGSEGAASGSSEISKTWKVVNPATSLRFTVLDCYPNFRKYWHAAEFQIFEAGGNGMATFILNNILNKYDAYAYGETMDIGDEPGQYANREAWEAFTKDVIWVLDWMNGDIEAEVTEAEAEELAARIEANYQAILDSKVPLKPISSGFYFITASLEYYATAGKVDENGEPVLDPETGEQVQETVYPTKAMYVDGTSLKWKNLDETDCTFLFRIDYNAEANNYTFYNCATNGRLNTVTQSANATLDPALDPIESSIIITLAAKDEETGREAVNICRADQASAQYSRIHQGSHSNGAGGSGNIVGWTVSDSPQSASSWYLVPVDEAIAQAMADEWAPIRDRNVMLEQVTSMIEQSVPAMRIARDIKTQILESEESRLITESTQFFSPNTTTDQQCEDLEEVYTYLLDGNTATYWHSRWEDGEKPAGTHYLQVELTNPEAVAAAAIKMTRRAVANDHITEWAVYGINEDNREEPAAKEACAFLGTINTPFGANDETVYSDAFETKGYKYIRFYIMNSVGTGISATRGYGHCSEFQLYPATVSENPNSQEKALGAIYTNLEAAIAAVPGNTDDITVEHFNTLKAAYDAFMAAFVDPSPLRAAIAAAENEAEKFTIGTTPGFWAEGGDAAFKATIANTIAYNEAGAYNAEKIDELIAGLTEATTAFFAGAINISTSKWYHIHMATEEQYTEYGFSTNNVIDATSGLGNLYGQYLTTGTIEQPEGDDNDFITPLNSEEVILGTRMFFTDKTGDDGSLFRFIAVGDTAYVIQNKASGLYINCAGANNNNVSMSLNPSIFKPRAVGYGQMVFAANSLAGANLTNLHAQKAGHRLVTWQAADAGSNSALFVEEADDVDFDSKYHFIREMRPGQIYAFSYPVAVSTSEGMYAVAGTYTAEDKYFVGINAIEEAKAGQPFLFIHNTIDAWTVPAEDAEDAEPATEPVSFSAGTDVVCTPDSINGLVGTFAQRAVEAGAVIFTENKATVTEGVNIAANSAFLRYGETTIEPNTCEIEIEIDGTPSETAINEVMSKVAKGGIIYDLNGRQIRSNGTINDVRNLGTGVYILNGAKIYVK